MTYWICGICVVLTIIICILLVKIISMRKAVDEIRIQFASRLNSDTNVGIDITTSDYKMRQLATDIDKQLKKLRKEHIRYNQGDLELKDKITNISHDLRTPLTAICGYIDLLESEDTSEQVRGYLDIVSNRVDALKLLTEELFRYSIVISDSQYDKWKYISLNQAIEDSIAAYYGALTGNGITPHISIPQTQIERRLNKVALSRILGNVIHNAIKYSDGDLSIVLSVDGAITFSNHAKNLDEVKVGRLFDRFYTVEIGENNTGLGLSIAKILTEQMKGSIRASKVEGIFSIEIRF